MSTEIYAEFVNHFLLKTKRDRFAKPQRLRDELRDTRYFDSRFLTAVPKAHQSVQAVARWFASRGASDRCYVVAGGERAGQFVDLRDGLEEAMFSGDEYLLYSPEAKSAYYEHHHGERFYLTKR